MTDQPDEDRGHHTSTRLPLDRFNGLSDGVFAIAITLLVLELPVPEGPDLVSSLLEEWPEFLGYLISFAFIGASWMTHALTTKYMKTGDTVAAGLNLLALLFITLIPFATNLMVSNIGGEGEQVAVLVYGLVVLVGSVSLTLLMTYLGRQQADLLGGEVADESLVALTRQRRMSVAVWVVAILCALIAPNVAVLLYVVAAVLMLALPILRVGRHRT